MIDRNRIVGTRTLELSFGFGRCIVGKGDALQLPFDLAISAMASWALYGRNRAMKNRSSRKECDASHYHGAGQPQWHVVSRFCVCWIEWLDGGKKQRRPFLHQYRSRKRRCLLGRQG